MSQEAYPLPRRDLFIRPDAGDIERDARSFVGDEGRLTDDQGAWYARTCSIMLNSKIGVGVIVVCAEAGEGCHDYSVLESEVCKLDGLEEFGSGHCSRRLLLSELLLGMITPTKVPFYRAASPQMSKGVHSGLYFLFSFFSESSVRRGGWRGGIG